MRVATAELNVAELAQPQFQRCEECSCWILGVEDGGDGPHPALVTRARQTGRRVSFVHRQSYFHTACLRRRVAYHRTRAYRLLTAVTAAAGGVAALTWLTGGPVILAAVLMALGAYAAYLEATDVRLLHRCLI